MRKSANFLIPAVMIAFYYVFWVVVTIWVLKKFPEMREILPVGGVDELSERDFDSFEPIYSSAEDMVLDTYGPVRLFFSSLGAALMIIPVSWVYFITSRAREVDQSFAQTILLMPVVVSGIAMIVLNSLALAFSLAGVVAAVRFRFSLKNPAHAMYIFAAIGIGLAAGIGALGVAAVISMTFCYGTLIIWKLEYGKVLTGPFFSMLTRRNRVEDDY
jgi:hypothetical protein